MKKSKMILLIVFSLLFFIIGGCIFKTKKSDKEILDWNSNIYSQIQNTGANPIPVDWFSLYSLEGWKNDIYLDLMFTKEKKLPLQYLPYLTHDIPLMPLTVADKIILCQTKYLQVLCQNHVYEYKFEKENILRITYPKEVGENVVIYLITSDPKRTTYAFKEIVFSEDSFMETEIAILNIPDSYKIGKWNSEVSFFSYFNDVISVVLTNEEWKSHIFQFSKNGDCIEKYSDGEIIIPNKFSDMNLWYVKKKKNDSKIASLMKDKEQIDEISSDICQGYFVSNSNIELFFYDAPNGPGWANLLSYLYDITERKITPVFFKAYWREENILLRSMIWKKTIAFVF